MTMDSSQNGQHEKNPTQSSTAQRIGRYKKATKPILYTSYVAWSIVVCLVAFASALEDKAYIGFGLLMGLLAGLPCLIVGVLSVRAYRRRLGLTPQDIYAHDVRASGILGDIDDPLPIHLKTSAEPMRIGFSGDGTLMAVISYRRALFGCTTSIGIWDMQTDPPTLKTEICARGIDDAMTVGFIDEKQTVIVGAPRRISQWSIATGKELREERADVDDGYDAGHMQVREVLTMVKQTSDGSLATHWGTGWLQNDGTVPYEQYRLWIKQGDRLEPLKLDDIYHSHYVTPDDKYVVAVTTRQEADEETRTMETITYVNVWDTTWLKLVRSFSLEGKEKLAACEITGDHVLLAARGTRELGKPTERVGRIEYWNVETGALTAQVQTDIREISVLTMTPDEKAIAVATEKDVIFYLNRLQS
jgi:hypothetical protein